VVSEAIWGRVAEDEDRTLQEILALQADITRRETHLAELRQFRAMLSAYAEEPERAILHSEPEAAPNILMAGEETLPTSADAMSREERLDLKNRIFGWTAPANQPS
jgi:hypothetical protein